jgi:hypothetical protein
MQCCVCATELDRSDEDVKMCEVCLTIFSRIKLLKERLAQAEKEFTERLVNKPQAKVPDRIGFKQPHQAIGTVSQNKSV